MKTDKKYYIVTTYIVAKNMYNTRVKNYKTCLTKKRIDQTSNNLNLIFRYPKETQNNTRSLKSLHHFSFRKLKTKQDNIVSDHGVISMQEP